MKKLIYLLLLLPSIMLGQAEFEKIAITETVKGNNATRVIVQDSVTKELKFVLKSTLSTNISIGNKNENTFQLLSSTGSGPIVPQATTTEAGLLNASDKTKINGVANGATANSTDAQLRDRTTHTGTQTASTISDIQSSITNNTAVLANTAKVSNATHTGDVAGSTALTLATVNSNIGTFNNVTVNGKGLVTGASNVTYASGGGTATGTNTGDNATNTQYSGLATSKENTITAGTTSQYFRGDKTFQELNKAAVGLANADNTSDLNKPISTATQTALDGKQNNLGFTPYNATNPSGFTANSTDAQLRDRTTHTGTQTASTISDIQSSITNNTAVLANTAKITNATHTGDVTGSAALTLATVNANVGTFNNVAVNGKGLVTSASNVTYATGSGSATGTNTGDQDLSGKANIASPTFTGTVSGITKQMVGLSNADNTSDANKPISTSTQTALNTKISGSGTTNQLAKFTGSGAVGPSSIFDNGNVGIATTDPTRKFTVDAGNGSSSSFFKGGLLRGDEILSSLLIGYQDNLVNNSAQYGYVYNTVSPLLSYAHITVFGKTEGQQYKFLANGNFGINQPIPIEKIDVVGNGKFSGTVQASPATASTHLATLGQVTKTQVGLANVENTSDLNKPISTATQTALDGKNPLISYLKFEDTTKSIWNNGSADISTNTSFGLFAASNKTSGGDEVAIGYNAGKNTFSGNTSNTQSQGSIYIGSGSTASGNNQTNQIVIGYNSIGFGSNSVVLGNTDITKTILRGTVSAEPATASNHLVTKSQLDTKISGSGTTNQIVKFTSSGAVAPAGITELANGFVGINQTDPKEKLDVVGNGKFSGSITSSSQFLAFGGVRRFITALEGSESGSNSGSSFSLFRYADSGDFLGRALLIRRANGFLGLNSPDPQEQLDVVGNGKFSGSVSASNGTSANHLVTKAQLDLKENLSNKQNSLAVDGTGIKFPTVDATNGGLVLKANLASPVLEGIPTAPTAAAGTNNTQIATTAFVIANSTAENYRVYTATLTQNNENAPVATLQQNSLSGLINWSRLSTGQYLGTLANEFTADLTNLFITPSFNGFYRIVRGNANTIVVSTSDTSGSLIDGFLQNTTIEIRVIYFE
jgi:hypothetical protein